jgi:hypothetical protein
MALSRYVLTATVTTAAGTPATVTAGEPGTGGAVGHGNASVSAGYSVYPQTFVAGTAHRARPGRAGLHGDRGVKPAPVCAGR